MVCIQFATDLHYELIYPGADSVFNIPAAQTANPLAVNEQLQISQSMRSTIQPRSQACARPPRLSTNATRRAA